MNNDGGDQQRKRKALQYASSRPRGSKYWHGARRLASYSAPGLRLTFEADGIIGLQGRDSGPSDILVVPKLPLEANPNSEAIPHCGNRLRDSTRLATLPHEDQALPETGASDS